MIKEAGRSSLYIKNKICFLEIIEMADLLSYQEMVDNNLKDGSIRVLVIINQGSVQKGSVNDSANGSLLDWINSRPCLVIAVGNGRCNMEFLALMMECDIRLGGIDLSVQFPREENIFHFDVMERCQLLMGKEGRRWEAQLTDQRLGAERLCEMGFINRMIDMNLLKEEVEDYINKLLQNRHDEQIEAILRCFRHYKQLGLNVNRQLLLEQESKEFCSLIIKEYEKSGLLHES